MNLSDHIMMNCNYPISKTAFNIPDLSLLCLKPKWVKTFFSINYQKNASTYPIYFIVLKSKIPGRSFKSYHTQIKTINMYLLRNHANCELLSK